MLIRLVREISLAGITVIWIEHVMKTMLGATDRLPGAGRRPGHRHRPTARRARLSGGPACLPRCLKAVSSPSRAAAGRRPILTVAGLSAWYGELRALHDVSFDVAPGEVLAVIGANGAGKSTLLKSITGMMNRGQAARIDGTVDMRGRRLNRLPTEKIVDAGVTMVPEGRRLFPAPDGDRQPARGRPTLPRCREKRTERLEAMFDLFPRLAERSDQLVSQMSGGEQQMVAIARALMSEPRIILFDELSLGLAPAVVDDIYGKIRQINAQGITCVIIEQDMKRALAASDHVIVLLEGAVVLQGDPAELEESAVTAAYFGSRTQGGPM